MRYIWVTSVILHNVLLLTPWKWERKKKQTWRRRAGATSLMWTSQPCNVPLFLCNNCWSALELNTDPITLHTASSLGSQQCSAVVNPSRVWVGEFAQTRTCFRSRTNASSVAFSSERNLRRTRCSLHFFSFFLWPFFSHFIRLYRYSRRRLTEFESCSWFLTMKCEVRAVGGRITN